jgi:hypothetical protein
MGHWPQEQIFLHEGQMLIIEITPLYLGLFLIMMLWFSFRIIKLRRKLRIGLGDGGNAEMLRAIRVHGNFIEQVPMTLLGLVLMELQGMHFIILHILGITLLIARLLHAKGITESSGVSKGRFIGSLITFGIQIILAISFIFNFIHLVIKESI